MDLSEVLERMRSAHTTRGSRQHVGQCNLISIEFPGKELTQCTCQKPPLNIFAAILDNCGNGIDPAYHRVPNLFFSGQEFMVFAVILMKDTSATTCWEVLQHLYE
jgi:hypothetical protein